MSPALALSHVIHIDAHEDRARVIESWVIPVIEKRLHAPAPPQCPAYDGPIYEKWTRPVLVDWKCACSLCIMCMWE